MNHTKGEWLRDGATVYTLQGSGEHAGKGKEYHELQINRIYFQVHCQHGTEGDAEEAARLIVALVNAAQRINPDNPMAVAENLERLVGVATKVQKTSAFSLAMSRLEAALSAIEAKK